MKFFRRRPEVARVDAILDAPRWMMESLCKAVTHYAPPCPECGGSLICEHVERREDWRERETGDSVMWAQETYRCDQGHLSRRMVELDRVTAKEQDEEREKAIRRARLSRELRQSGFAFLELFKPGIVQRTVEHEYPRRPDPELLERYHERLTQASPSPPKNSLAEPEREG